jgi:cytochrome c-type biogenesis protein CcmH/NrfG
VSERSHTYGEPHVGDLHRCRLRARRRVAHQDGGDAPSDWLLGSILNAVAAGGTAAIAYGTALALAAAYVTLGLVIAGIVFIRREVTD